ncbi:MAG: ApaLI family restriction endonuclease [Candidatus Omnitrophota bacterium]
MSGIKEKIKILARNYSEDLNKKITERVKKMDSDDKSHYLIYRVLGVTNQEGELIDIYQNKGRFLYKYAGALLEESAILCFEEKFENTKKKVRIPNTHGSRPKTFEIDCLIGTEAYEIKWRDATTDGDHITKEHTRVKNIKEAGFKPIRIMFYYPNRDQAIKIQETIETIYSGIGGEYNYGNKAWELIRKKTGVDLFKIMEEIAEENSKKQLK